jgi:hypothetical protein
VLKLTGIYARFLAGRNIFAPVLDPQPAQEQPSGHAQPPHLPVIPPASTRDSQCRLLLVGLKDLSDAIQRQ